MNELVAVAQCAQQITIALRQSIEGVIEAGTLLSRARREFRAEIWRGMIERDLPFSLRTAQRLIAIAEDKRIATHMSRLPSHWGTLYELTRLDNDTFAAHLNDGTICVDMERADIAQVIKQERRAERERKLGQKQTALPEKKYGVIVADPEWRYEPWSRQSGMDRAADNHYPTSGTDVIAARDVRSIAADDCTLALWAIVPMLPEALCVLDAWGFARFERDPSSGLLTLDKRSARYVSSASWTKYKPGAGIGLGHWFRVDHEILLIATRGKPPAPAKGKQARSVFDIPASEIHSQKPECVLEILETYFPTLPKIELNRRGAARPGWDAWGNEAA